MRTWQMTVMAPRLSVVVPAYNEEQSIPFFVDETCAVLNGLRCSYELICVDDGSTDSTTQVLTSLKASYPALRPATLDRHHGQTAALAAGISMARGQIVLLSDCDLQNDPADIPRMLAVLEGPEAWDCVIGVRISRQDSWLRGVSSDIANSVAGRITKHRFRDGACGLKACRAPLLKQIPFFRGAHRFVGTLMAIEGARVVEIEVNHRRRRFGSSRYGSGLGRGVG